MKIVLLTPLLGLYAFANSGTIMAPKGKATTQRGISINAKMGTSIKQSNSVQTKAQSLVQIMLKDDSVITIRANSSFDFKEYQSDGTRSSQETFKIHRGCI
jgi:hypothetical protein